MKRLYADVGVVAAPDGGFAIALDGRPVKTPGRNRLLLPNAPLARSIADEWNAQAAEIRPHTMPLMQLAATVLDHLSIYRDAVRRAVLRFAETDAVCYRAEAPTELVRLQLAFWDPLLDWLDATHGARLRATDGLVPVAQDAHALARLDALVEAMDDWRLGAFQSAVSTAGSFVIALALIEGRLDPESAFHAAELEASFEIERWGEDGESIARRAVVAADLAAASRFHTLLAADEGLAADIGLAG